MEKVLQEMRDECGAVILRLVQLPDGLVAVDLECAEARALAKSFLPGVPVAVRDRPGKPNSRWVYRTR